MPCAIASSLAFLMACRCEFFLANSVIKLKQLENDKIINRIEYKEKPPHVQYFLTEKGKGLKKVVDALLDYGEKYL